MKNEHLYKNARILESYNVFTVVFSGKKFSSLYEAKKHIDEKRP